MVYFDVLIIELIFPDVTVSYVFHTTFCWHLVVVMFHFRHM